MRVRLTIDVYSPDGAALAEELEEYVDDLEYRCSCPDGETCQVVVQEELDRCFDVIVSRPGYSPPPDGSWAVVRRERECRYIASFRGPTAGLLASAIAQLIAMPLIELL